MDKKANPNSWRWWLLLLVLPRMKCEIPGREKDIEGSLDSWLKDLCCLVLFWGSWDVPRRSLPCAYFCFPKDQLTKDASVIQEKVPWVKPWLRKRWYHERELREHETWAEWIEHNKTWTIVRKPGKHFQMLVRFYLRNWPMIKWYPSAVLPCHSHCEISGKLHLAGANNHWALARILEWGNVLQWSHEQVGRLDISGSRNQGE